MVSQIHEQKVAMVPFPVDPAGQTDGAPGVFIIQVIASVRTIEMHVPVLRFKSESQKHNEAAYLSRQDLYQIADLHCMQDLPAHIAESIALA